MSIFVISIVIIIVIVCITLIGLAAFNKESFIDIYASPYAKYKDDTKTYNDIDDSLKGTPIVNVSSVDTNRFPIAIETTMNWFSTQPLVLDTKYNNLEKLKLSPTDCDCL